MAQTIWKFPLAMTVQQKVSMPVGARILHVGTQGDSVCLWALVDPSRDTNDRTILVAGTGHPIEMNGADDYIGTFMLHGGTLVFHVFDMSF